MKTQESQNSIAPRVTSEPSNRGTAQLKDNRTSTIDQRKLQNTMHATTVSNANLIQRKNKTGLPNNLKSGIEKLSGYSMDDVKVHYNSNKPAQLQAHAYAQGTNIHLAPGEEKHLPHEAWHVVQQKQGRVQPTRQLKSKININDDAGLEREADVMGDKAFNSNKQIIPYQLITKSISENKRTVVQGYVYNHDDSIDSIEYKDNDSEELRSDLEKILNSYIHPKDLFVVTFYLSKFLLDSTGEGGFMTEDCNIYLNEVERVVKKIYKLRGEKQLTQSQYKIIVNGINTGINELRSISFEKEIEGEHLILKQIDFDNGEITESTASWMLGLIDIDQTKEDAKLIASIVEEEAADNRDYSNERVDEEAEKNIIKKWIEDPSGFNNENVREAKTRGDISGQSKDYHDPVTHMLSLYNSNPERLLKKEKIVYRLQKYDRKKGEIIPYRIATRKSKKDNSIVAGDFIMNRGLWSTSQHRRLILGEPDDTVVTYAKEGRDYQENPISVVKMIIHTKKGVAVGGNYNGKPAMHSNDYKYTRNSMILRDGIPNLEKLLRLDEARLIKLENNPIKEMVYQRLKKFRSYEFAKAQQKHEINRAKRNLELVRKKYSGDLSPPGQAEILLDTHSVFKVIDIRIGDKGKKYDDYNVVLQEVNSEEFDNLQLKDAFTGEVI